MKLPAGEAGGQRAIERLGSNLDPIARWYGKSGNGAEARAAARQAAEDRRDRPSLRDREAGQAAVRPARQGSARSGTVASGQLAPLADTFKLHSKPDAQRTLVLNFQGATLQNTGWNRGVATIKAQPFDIDGKPAAFSDAELQRIQYIWQRVAEDFAPFDLNVTTEVVAQDRLVRSSAADMVYGGTVLVTNNQGVYSCTCGGVAYVRGFGNAAYNTGLAFPNMLATMKRTSRKPSRTRRATCWACCMTAHPPAPITGARATTPSPAGRPSWVWATTSRSCSGARANMPMPTTRRTTSP